MAPPGSYVIHARMTLTAKQQRFVEEYMIDASASGAAARAGYSARSAGRIGYELLEKTHIAAAIREKQAERSESTRINAAWVLSRLAQEAEADLSDLYAEDGSLKPVREWPKIWRQGLVQGVETDEDPEGGGRIRKVKLSDRVKRLELIGKHIGVKAFEERVDVTVHDALADRLRKARERSRGE